MGNISAKALSNALAKARNVGLVEESCTIEDCEIVLRNLRPEEYSDIIQDCDGLDEVKFLNAYQKGHISRSIVEVNGVDLRDVTTVVVEEDDPRNPGQQKKVQRELHRYLLKNMLDSWSKEALYTAFRKFSDVVELAERKAKDGITFLVPEETPEDKYRRLLQEVRALEQDIPETVIEDALDDAGLVRKATKEELELVGARTAQIAKDLRAKEEDAEDPPAPQSVSEQPAASVSPRVFPTNPVRDPHQELRKAIDSRKSRQPAVEAVEVSTTSSKAAEIADIEGEAFTPFSVPPERLRDDQNEVIEVRKAVVAPPGVIDPPLTAGINPRFRPSRG